MSVQTDIKLSFDARFEIAPVRWSGEGGLRNTVYSIWVRLQLLLFVNWIQDYIVSL